MLRSYDEGFHSFRAKAQQHATHRAAAQPQKSDRQIKWNQKQTKKKISRLSYLLIGGSPHEVAGWANVHRRTIDNCF